MAKKEFIPKTLTVLFKRCTVAPLVLMLSFVITVSANAGAPTPAQSTKEVVKKRQSLLNRIGPAAELLLDGEARACGKDLTCFLKNMKNTAKESRPAYIFATKHMSPTVRNAIGPRCIQNNTEVLNQILCYKIGLDDMVNLIDRAFELRTTESAAELLGDIARNDQGKKTKHFIRAAAEEVCGSGVTDDCFDKNLSLLSGQIRVARDNIYVTFYQLIRWGVHSYRCSQKLGDGACDKNQQWPLSLFVAPESECPYVGLNGHQVAPVKYVADPPAKPKKPAKPPASDPRRKTDGSPVLIPIKPDELKKDPTKKAGPKNGDDFGADMSFGDKPLKADSPSDDPLNLGSASNEDDPVKQSDPKKITDPSTPPNNAVADPNKNPDDLSTGPIDRFWSPTPFETGAGKKTGNIDYCSTDAITAATQAAAANENSIQAMSGQAKLFICDVKDRLIKHPEESAPAQQSLLVLSAVVANMVSIAADPSVNNTSKYFDWLAAELQRLRDTKGIPGQAELGALVTYLQNAKKMPPLVLFSTVSSHNGASSELSSTFFPPAIACPWLKAVAAAAVDSTKQFPTTILNCTDN